MDFRALLKKYINHVGVIEGTTFIGSEMPDEFTQEDCHHLDLIVEEISNEYDRETPVTPS